MLNCVSSKISLRILVVYQKIDSIFIAVATVSDNQGNCLLLVRTTQHELFESLMGCK